MTLFFFFYFCAILTSTLMKTKTFYNEKRKIMKGILLRGIIEVVGYILTLPLRLIVIIGSICFYIPYVSIRYEYSFMEGLKEFARGMKASFLNEITWVKTGNCKDFDELMTDLTSEEES